MSGADGVTAVGDGIYRLYPPSDEQALADDAAWLKLTGRRRAI